MENFYFYSSKETKSKEVTQGSETNERNVRKAGLLNSISFFSFGCRGVAGRGARRQRGLQGVPQPVANSLNDELRFFQMTILRWVDHYFPRTIVKNGPPRLVKYGLRTALLSRRTISFSKERIDPKRLPRKLDYDFQFETFSFPERKQKKDLNRISFSSRTDDTGISFRIDERKRCRRKLDGNTIFVDHIIPLPSSPTGVIKMGRYHCAPRRKVCLSA